MYGNAQIGQKRSCGGGRFGVFGGRGAPHGVPYWMVQALGNLVLRNGRAGAERFSVKADHWEHMESSCLEEFESARFVSEGREHSQGIIFTSK
jgi:hypothetical protein